MQMVLCIDAWPECLSPAVAWRMLIVKQRLAELTICSSQSTALWEKPLHAKPNGFKKTRLQIRADSAVTFATQLCAYIIHIGLCLLYHPSISRCHLYIKNITFSLSLNLSLLFLISAIFIYNLFFALSLRPLALGSFDPREALWEMWAGKPLLGQVVCWN